jgi:hypothetical protein
MLVCHVEPGADNFHRLGAARCIVAGTPASLLGLLESYNSLLPLHTAWMSVGRRHSLPLKTTPPFPPGKERWWLMGGNYQRASDAKQMLTCHAEQAHNNADMM